LRIDGISSKKLDVGLEGSLKNNNLYNDKELWDDADLNWYDYGYRNYDPQIGRFPQLDPLTDNYPELTNYQYASNDPILNIDLDGLEGVPTPGGLWNGSFLEQE
jgi:RHS repeat-associated protein